MTTGLPTTWTAHLSILPSFLPAWTSNAVTMGVVLIAACAMPTRFASTTNAYASPSVTGNSAAAMAAAAVVEAAHQVKDVRPKACVPQIAHLHATVSSAAMTAVAMSAASARKTRNTA